MQLALLPSSQILHCLRTIEQNFFETPGRSRWISFTKGMNLSYKESLEPQEHAAGVCHRFLYRPVGDHSSEMGLRKRLENVTETLSVKHLAHCA